MSTAIGSNALLQIKDDELLIKLRNTEDSFVERKRLSETSDWLRTAVAFANSTPIGFPAILFIGIKNDGTIEDANDLEAVEKRLSTVLANAYPPIYYWTRVLAYGAKQLLAVIIPGSDNRPHFSGRAYVRDECESKEASEKLLTELIAAKNDKAREILKWKDKAITIVTLNTERVMHTVGRISSKQQRFVRECNTFYVTVAESDNQGSTHRSYSLRNVDVCFDDDNARLALEIRPS